MTTPTLREAAQAAADSLAAVLAQVIADSTPERKAARLALDALRAALAAQPAQSPTWPDHMPLAQRLQLIAHRCSDHEAVESLGEVIASLAAQPAPAVAQQGPERSARMTG